MGVRSARAVFPVLAAVVVSCGALVAPARAQQFDPNGSPSQSQSGSVAPEPLSLAELLPDSNLLHPDLLAHLSVSPAELGPAAEQLETAWFDLRDADARLAAARAERIRLVAEAEWLEAVLKRAIDERTAAAAAEEKATDDLRAFAVSTFVGFEEIALNDFKAGPEAMSVATLSEESERFLRVTLEAAVARHERAVADVETREAAVRANLAELLAVEQKRIQALADQTDAADRIDVHTPDVEAALLFHRISGTDLQAVVLDAYYRAERRTADERPTCRVQWEHLAGIGRVESGHGTHGGSSVGPDGRTTKEILGPVLDGTVFSLIPDSEGGALDGNAVFDRAVGPMQFIPTSWEIYGRDGNDDGRVDPHNLYDAAMAAAGHLCGSIHGLDQRGNFQHALLGYNGSVEYGLEVMSHTDRYLRIIGRVEQLPEEVEEIVDPESGAEPTAEEEVAAEPQAVEAESERRIRTRTVG